ncbi:amino acid deaminase/aldolase [Paenibacillus paeoniae]|uniref:Amino acid deaminase/aldolase n=1 Tax=Paenibacillus paeoniae TaxID=2292705 RepID=A0A371P7C3_9BACL|nr:amino acid deaminase/aldolase [Paenibacillus paeoniae]REK71851.1 amino acid deaminase/aldolase [Paenibacillus paeoniae]
MGTYVEYKEGFAGLPLPFAYVDVDRLERNIAAIASAAGGKRVRIASKSIRSVDVLKKILAAHPCYQGVMCYTAAEADFLAGQGIDDLLLGYPQGISPSVDRLLDRIADGRTVSFMVDCIEHVEELERHARARGVIVPLCLDLDLSVSYPGLRFGVWRSPLSSWEKMKPVAERIVDSPWLVLDGLMGYEAQVAGVGDNAPGAAMRNGMIRWLKKRSIAEVSRRREEAVRGIEALGVKLRFVNAGGTGSLDSSRLESWVTELTAGSGFYSPGLFDNYVSFRYEPAAGFAVEVVRRPTEHIVTCLGGGYVASGAAGTDKLPKPYLPEGLSLLPLEGAGEVQTPLRCPQDVQLAIGDPVFFRHAKAGELGERFPVLYAISKGAIVGQYSTYRGMGECFL